MLLHKNNFFLIEYFEDSKTLYSFWINNENVSVEQYKNELLRYAELAMQYTPTNYLSNNQNSTFTITPDIQTWIIENIFSKTMHKGVKRFALVVSPDMFAQFSIEQVVDDNPNHIQTVYFENDQSAWDWIKK